MAKSNPKNLVDLVCEALDYRAAEWENGEPIGGADLVDFFGGWRTRVRRFLHRDEREPNDVRVSDRELAVILSALRYFQANIDEIRQLNREAPLEHFKAGFTFPTAKQIDRLAERINQ
jgi:hypothetical protein